LRRTRPNFGSLNLSIPMNSVPFVKKFKLIRAFPECWIIKVCPPHDQ
jgi:hypothetical protein